MLKQLILCAGAAILAATGVQADSFLPQHSYQNGTIIEAAWNDRVQQYFPVGTPVDKMMATLEDEGFVIDAAWSHADLQLPGLFCRKRFQMVWTGDTTVESVVGTFGLICL
jgi:hypothetical protein